MLVLSDGCRAVAVSVVVVPESVAPRPVVREVVREAVLREREYEVRLLLARLGSGKGRLGIEEKGKGPMEGAEICVSKARFLAGSGGGISEAERVCFLGFLWRNLFCCWWGWGGRGGGMFWSCKK